MPKSKEYLTKSEVFMEQKQTAKSLTQVLIYSLACLSLLATGCSKSGSFKALDSAVCPSPTCTPEQNKESLKPPTDASPEEVYKGVDLTGKIQGGMYNNSVAMELDKQNHALILYLPVGTNMFIGNVSGSIPELPGASFKTVKRQNGTSVVALSIPIKYLIRGIDFLDPAKLPNGDPLPEIPGGELPSLAIKLGDKENVNLYLYVGVSVVAVYVSSPFNPYMDLTFPVTNKDETKVVGYFSTVSEKTKDGTKYLGGFFLSTIMPDEISRILDDHF